MARKRVLVVDDILSIRQVITTLLRSGGFDAIEASSAEMGLELMQKTSVDLVLSDWNMPGMTGPQFVAAIRAKYPSLPIVMVTAESDRKKILELKELGVSGYLLKPFKQDALLAVVARVFPEPKQNKSPVR